MNKISIDFETRSRTDLRRDGVYNYATCPSTEIICLSWAFNNGEPTTWKPLEGQPFPAQLAKYIRDGLPLRAHNAAFERLMFDFIVCPEQGLPAIPLEQWHCTAFQARCNNLPGALFDAARCLGVKHQKDRKGRNLIAMLCVPGMDGKFNEDPSLLEEMYDYCEQDVRAERNISEIMREPTPGEWADYWCSERINDRGVMVDVELARAAQQYAKEETADIVRQVKKLSRGAVEKFRGPALLEWVKARVNPDQLERLVVYRDGEKKYSLDKYSRHRLLDATDLDPVVREVVMCADTAHKSSVGKYAALEHRADPEDWRMRGAFVANGASQSGRFASWGAQLHNFPRDVMPDPPEVRLDLVENIVAKDIVDYFERPIMEILSAMLRPTLVAGPDREFLVSDWSAIEGRVGPWISASQSGELKLELYRNGVDTYKSAACDIYRTSYEQVDDSQRQVGKVAELALGFGGGAGAFQGMARGYGVKVTKSQAEEIKVAWRNANQWAVDMWKACEQAAMSALKHPNEMFEAGRVMYFCFENVLVGARTLFCLLPCGRLLTYPDARIELRMAPWGEEVLGITAMRANWVPKVTETEWPRATLWGGLLVENIVQGAAASLLRNALLRCQDAGLPVVLHVHDEIVVEVNRKQSEKAAAKLHAIMNTPPEWAEGLPLKADVNTVLRFGK